ncbi:transglycosylase SLT domain-containing protein [Nocardioides mangrovi]|uniref:Transglycosylase SLT domain-containing protein n=1 Tax=Nocardioides mangrovi TaxID=2874580 RepID=A0ABS7UG85_9ACTN|nr:transglycosylase SLT domain-containing protein [Nocardioides mangrovi]MBZ5739844.1 transglycosylase SLT domain-containing protein [Nocardioides mangrovi]
MSKHAKYTPKHRHVAERPARTAIKKAVVMSSVAVAATGVAVSGGVLGQPTGVPTVADDLGSATGATLAGHAGDSDTDRAPVATRSFDRRGDADPAKKAALSAGTGPAVTRSVELSDGDPRDIAQALMPQFGFSSDQFGCLDSLWTRESGWNPAAQNASSGAFGIPQALPGSKMASAGADWATNPATQIEWGLGYIQDRYGSPCGAWSHSESYGWY